jgi:hypothetical protein
MFSDDIDGCFAYYYMMVMIPEKEMKTVILKAISEPVQ